MHGNVYEWIADPWHENYENAPSDGSVWRDNPVPSRHVARSGSWYFDAKTAIGEPRWSPFQSPGWQCRAARRANFAKRSVAVPRRRHGWRRRPGSKGLLSGTISAASESRPNPVLTPPLRRGTGSLRCPIFAAPHEFFCWPTACGARSRGMSVAGEKGEGGFE
jgi:Sulfatase-modifying factor enzyme 1